LVGIEFNKMLVVNGEVYILGSASSSFVPTTGPTDPNSSSMALVMKINAAGNIVASTFIQANYVEDLQVLNGAVYLLGTTSYSSFPIVNGIGSSNLGNGVYQTAFLVKLDATTFATILSTCLTNAGSPYYNFVGSLRTDGSSLYILTDGGCDFYPVTDGTTGPLALIKLNTDGTTVYSTRYSDGETTGSGTYYFDMQASNGQAYVFYNTFTGTTLSGASYRVYDATGKLSQLVPVSPVNGPMLRVENGIGYIVGNTTNASFNVTSGTGRAFGGGAIPAVYFYPAGDFYIQRISSTGIIYDSYLGGSGGEIFQGSDDNDNLFQVLNGNMYIYGLTNSADYPVTDGSKKTTPPSTNTPVLTKINAAGNIVYSTFYSNSPSIDLVGLAVDNNIIYLSSYMSDNSMPTTDGSSFGNGSYGYGPYTSALYECPTNYVQIKDTLSPSSQTVCKYGLASQINGKDVIIPGDSLPLIYHNGVAAEQNQLNANYQWQIATSAAGPWTNIPGAVSKNYFPAVGGVTQYYRRVSQYSVSCGSAIISTSNVDTVAVNTLTAPTVAAGGPFTTCPGSSITIGGSPTATGGIAPYTYSWDNNAGTLANPVVTPLSNTLYTATVTDSKGCVQIGQSLVNIYSANAGPDVSVCGTDSVMIGSPIIPGLTGVSYSWSPATGMGCPTCAQPKVKISGAPVTYTLTQTITKSGGGTCSSSDNVVVTPVMAPTANFAGPDQTICSGGTAQLGTTAQAGYTYTWSPGTYLTNNSTATTTFNAGSYAFPPTPDPTSFYVTATNGSCSFYDTVIVTTILSYAGIDGCGPRQVGTPDATPNVNETYSWTKISGTGTITGATNTPVTTVSASTGGSSVYQLNVSYGGTTCTSQVNVPSTCECNAQIVVSAPHACPTTALGSVILTAIPSFGAITDWKYSWSPTAGLSSPTGNVDTLTDQVARTYTVTITNIYDPTIFCSVSIAVNNPSWSLPAVTNKTAAICSGVAANLGGPAIAHYGYAWSGYNNGNTYFTSTIADPQVVLTANSSYNVIETDSTSGCTATGTSVVTVDNPIVDAGPYYEICNNAVVTIGTPAVPGETYSWSPSTAPWQNGTSATSAMPQVLAAAGQTLYYTVTATSPGGCSASSQTLIYYDPSPQVTPSGDKTVCSGSSVQIGSAIIPGAIYNWTPATGLSCTTCAQPYTTVTSNTTYTDVVTFLGGCNSTDIVNVTVDKPTFTLPNISFCPSQTLSLGNNAPAGMSAYQWSPSSIVSNSTIANPVASPIPNTTTTYTLTVTDANGCTASSTETAIPSLAKPIAGSNRIICSGSPQQIGDPSNLSTDTWSVQSAPGSYSFSCTSCAQPYFTAMSPGTYVVNVNRPGACSSSDNLTITVDSFAIPATNPITVCKGTCAPIGVANQPGIVYSWLPSTGLSDPTVSMPTACVSANTNYVLTAIDGNACVATMAAYVAVNSVASPSITIPGITICLTNQVPVAFNPLITGPAGSTYSYAWTPSTGLSNPSVLAPTVSTASTTPVTYTLTVTNIATGCQSTATGIASTSLCNIVSVTISGTVLHDANGLTDNIVNGTGLGNPSSTTLYATLINASGKVVANVTVAANGTYSFTQVAVGQYTIQISKTAGVVNSAAPAKALPTNWIYTGENIGTGAGSDGTPNGAISITVVSAAITNIDFGIEQPPVADPKCFNITDCLFTNNSIAGYVGIAMNSTSLTGYSTGGSLTGSDPEDCKNSSSCNTGATFIIASINSTTLLYYTYTTTLVKVTAGTKISNFDPSKMVIFKKIGSSVSFTYSMVDKAGVASPAVTYTINAVASTIPYGKTIWLRSCENKYVSCENGCKPMCSDGCSVSCWEEFQVIDAGDCKVSLKCEGKYVSCENGEKPITCNRTTAQDWEEFDWIQNSDGKICLRGSNGKYVSCEGGISAMTCNRDVASSWEEFDWKTCSNSNCGCSNNNSNSQTAESYGRPEETADQSSVTAPLTFTVYPNPGKDIVTVALSEASTEAAQIVLINQLGAVVETATLDANVLTTQLNVSALPGGIYMVKLQANGQILTSELLVK